MSHLTDTNEKRRYMSNLRNSKIDGLRSGIIDELIDADNWFAVVKTDKKVKVFANTSPEMLANSLTTLMVNEDTFAQTIIRALNGYCKAKRGNINGVFIPFSNN